MTIFSRDIDKAIYLAARAHDGQYRKVRNAIPVAPYVSHPFSVALLLSRAHFSDATIIAGILHDIVEDTPVLIEDIREQFGEEVAEMVSLLTVPEDLSFKDMKLRQAATIKTASDEVRAVKAADTLHNAYSMLVALKEGEDIWSSLEQSKKEYLWGYRTLLTALREVWDHEILDALEDTIVELEGFSHTT